MAPPIMSVPITSVVAQFMLTIFTAILSFVAALYWANRNAKKESVARVAAAESALKLRVLALETQLAVVNQSIQPISVAFQAILIKQLTHYHTPKLDALLKKLGPPLCLTADEEVEIGRLLHERTRDMHDEIDQSERDAATMLPFVMARVRHELTEPPADIDLVVVKMPKSYE